MRNKLLRYSKYLAILLLAGSLSSIMHEYGHFVALKALGYRPHVNFCAGRVEHYDSAGNLDPELSPNEKIISSAGGPSVTLLLAIFFTVLFLRRRESFTLFAFAITNAVMRLNMIIDGFNSDEGNISQTLLNLMGPQGAFIVPLVVWTVAVGLSCHLVKNQVFFKRTVWLIPLFFIVGGVSMIASFKVLGLVF